MNITITKLEHEELLNYKTNEYLIGSKLYGVQKEQSDTDLLCFYKVPPSWLNHTQFMSLPNIHHFQYKCHLTETDFIWTSAYQFWKNQLSGESTINSDLIMFDQQFREDFGIKDPQKYLFTFKVIRSYLGFAKRDIKQYREGYHKIVHAERCLLIATYLIEHPKIPTLMELQQHLYAIQKLEGTYEVDKWKIYVESLSIREKNLRLLLNKMYDSATIKSFPDFDFNANTMQYESPAIQSLFYKIMNSNNTNEFRYD